MNVRRYHVFLYVGLWLLIGAGVYGASYCYDQHICRDGHMAHPEMKTYWPREYAIDALWSGCLLTVPILCFAFRLRSVRWLSLMFPAFLIYRFILGG